LIRNKRIRKGNAERNLIAQLVMDNYESDEIAKRQEMIVLLCPVWDKFQVPSAKFQVTNSRYQIPNTKFQVPNSKHQIPSFKKKCKKNAFVLLR
jgi:hypothetical protein